MKGITIEPVASGHLFGNAHQHRLRCLAGDETVPQLEDFFTLQSTGEEYLSPHGIGLNLSRFHWTGLPIADEYMVLPGYGIRGTFGHTNRLELLGKLTLGGFLGASTGPYFGEDGYGLAASAWYGAGLVGWGTLQFWGDGGMETEVRECPSRSNSDPRTTGSIGSGTIS